VAPLIRPQRPQQQQQQQQQQYGAGSHSAPTSVKVSHSLHAADNDFGDFEGPATTNSGAAQSVKANPANKWGDLGGLVDLSGVKKNEAPMTKTGGPAGASTAYTQSAFAGLDGFSKTPQSMSAVNSNRPLGYIAPVSAPQQSAMLARSAPTGAPMMGGGAAPMMGGGGYGGGAAPLGGGYGAPMMGGGFQQPPQYQQQQQQGFGGPAPMGYPNNNMMGGGGGFAPQQPAGGYPGMGGGFPQQQGGFPQQGGYQANNRNPNGGW